MEQRSPTVIVLAHQTGHALELTISQVGHPRLELSKKAIAQLLPLFKDRRVMNFMTDRVDLLLSTVVTQLRNLQSLLPSEHPENRREISQHYNHILRLIASIFKEENARLISNVTQSTFCELIYVFISIMTDPDTELLPNGTSILKTMNILVLQIIETSEPHCVICGLLGVLNLAVQMTTNRNLLNIVLKCEAKLLKQFENWKEKEKVIIDKDMEAIIREFHSFISKHTCRATLPEDAIPIKMMRVILQKLFVFSGSHKILAVMDKMTDLKGSKTEVFIRKIGSRGNFTGTMSSGTWSTVGISTPAVMINTLSEGSTIFFGSPAYASTPNTFGQINK